MSTMNAKTCRASFLVAGVVFLALSLLAMNKAGAADAPFDDGVLLSVSFREPLSDESLMVFLGLYEASPRRLLIVAGDMYGSYRPVDGLSLVENLALRRQQLATNQQEARRLLALTAQHLLNSLSTGEFAQSQDLQHQASIILRRHKSAYAAEEAARSGAPLVYGAELLVSNKRVHSLRQDARIMRLIPALPITTKGGTQFVLPEPSRSPILLHDTASVDPLPPGTLLSNLRTLLELAAVETETEGGVN